MTKISGRTAGNSMDRAIATFVQREYKIAVGTQTAERLSMELGSALPLAEEESAEVRGHLLTGPPKRVLISAQKIGEAISPTVEAARDTLDRTPPELASDVVERGKVLAGGGALLRSLDERLRLETGVAIHVAEDPLGGVAVGSGRYLEELGHFPGTTRSSG